LAGHGPDRGTRHPILRSGKWYRGNGKNVARFEEVYSQLTGARACLATANGTSALFTSLNTTGIEPGDEVIVPPYTFIATVNAVLRQ
jgi:dTDP-4-amino-4,6-dideoxygalactose transaminase